MKIYTKNGDKGQTRIIGKQILFKSDPRVEAYGEIDELNSWVGYTRSLLTPQTAKLSNELEEIQQLLLSSYSHNTLSCFQVLHLAGKPFLEPRPLPSAQPRRDGQTLWK